MEEHFGAMKKLVPALTRTPMESRDQSGRNVEFRMADVHGLRPGHDASARVTFPPAESDRRGALGTRVERVRSRAGRRSLGSSRRPHPSASSALFLLSSATFFQHALQYANSCPQGPDLRITAASFRVLHFLHMDHTEKLLQGYAESFMMLIDENVLFSMVAVMFASVQHTRVALVFRAAPCSNVSMRCVSGSPAS